MKTRILFLDDEPLALQGLQRMLRSMRKDWEMVFVENGPRALELLDQNPFEIVVTDMMMPGMDGAQFLREVARKHPQTTRLILSGHADKNLILKAAGAAHQYLAKPCPAELLKSVLRRIGALQQSIPKPSLRAKMASIDHLSCSPAVFGQILEKIKAPEAPGEEIGRLVGHDPGLSSKILKLVNSAFFGVQKEIYDVSEAVARLGMDVVRALFTTEQAFSTFPSESFSGSVADRMIRHANAVASASRLIVKEENPARKLVEQAYTAGLLHDVGKFVLAGHFPEEYDAAAQLVSQHAMDWVSAEKEVLGTSHAEMGAYLLGLWGLPGEVVDAIAWHHSPERDQVNGFSLVTSVHVANDLVHEMTGCGNGRPASRRLQNDYLHAIGCRDRLPDWKQRLETSEDLARAV